MKIDGFNIEYNYIRKFFEYLNDYEIIEFIIKIEKVKLYDILINILKERKISIQKVSSYIISNNKNYQMIKII